MHGFMQRTMLEVMRCGCIDVLERGSHKHYPYMKRRDWPSIRGYDRYKWWFRGPIYGAHNAQPGLSARVDFVARLLPRYYKELKKN